MSVKLNNTLVTQQNDTYAYKAYLESLLGYPKDGLESYLTCALWYKDKENPFNTTDVTGGTPGASNSAVARLALISGSKLCQMIGTPAHALFHTDRYFPGDININIRIDMNSEAFCLKSAAGTEILHIVNRISPALREDQRSWQVATHCHHDVWQTTERNCVLHRWESETLK